jgi:hypothetical protein|tara:strand:- start:2168 stop:3181 length:1014 start_codon:yes stop_codon:yes gene_type:complete
LSKSKKIKTILNVVLKILVSLGSIIYLVYLLSYQKEDLIEEVKIFFATQHFSIPKLLILVLLMMVNWGTEVFKWRLLVRGLFPMSWIFAIKTQLCSVAASVFTPYRIGGYFGKVALLEHQHRANGFVLQLFNAMGMFITNFFYGLLFIGILGYQADKDIYGISSELISIVGFIGASIVLVFWVLFINVNTVTFLFERVWWTNKWAEYWDILRGADYKKNAFILLSVSNLRYIVITYQYVLAFQVFGIKIDQQDLFLASGALFFLFQFLPVFNAFELGASRASLFSIILIGYGIVDSFDEQQVIAMTSACFFIWFINLAIPYVLGSIFLSKMKVLKES